MSNNKPTPSASPLPPQPISPAHPLAAAHQETQTESFWDSHHAHIGQFYLTKGVTLILITQALFALYNSITFIFIKMPQFEQQLHLQQISPPQVNELANKAIIMTISTILSLFFALKISMVQSKAAQRINTALAILIVIGNTQISNFLLQIGSTRLITSIILDSLKSMLSL